MDQLSLFKMGGEACPTPKVLPEPVKVVREKEVDVDLSAMRRQLYERGRSIGKDLGVESVERFGMPIYRLPREIVEWWLQVLDEKAKGVV